MPLQRHAGVDGAPSQLCPISLVLTFCVGDFPDPGDLARAPLEIRESSEQTHSGVARARRVRRMSGLGSAKSSARALDLRWAVLGPRKL